MDLYLCGSWHGWEKFLTTIHLGVLSLRNEMFPNGENPQPYRSGYDRRKTCLKCSRRLHYTPWIQHRLGPLPCSSKDPHPALCSKERSSRKTRKVRSRKTAITTRTTDWLPTSQRGGRPIKVRGRINTKIWSGKKDACADKNIEAEIGVSGLQE